MIHVVAGVVYDTDDRILIAQRPPGKHLAGGWEFPGGKLESGEAPRDGLARELREELGIVIATPRPLLRLLHTYPYGDVLLDVWVVRHYRGTPASLDGQALRWCGQSELEATTLLPADGPVVAALRLPEVLTRLSDLGYEIVDADGLSRAHAEPHSGDPATLRGALCKSVEAARESASAGAAFLVVAEEPADEAVRGLCDAVSVPVFIRSASLEQAWSLGASGIHRLAVRPKMNQSVPSRWPAS